MKQRYLRTVREVLEAKQQGLSVEHRDTNVSLEFKPVINTASLYQHSSVDYQFNITDQYRLID